ncbi:MAG: hypothetical protein WCE38_04010 [Burkholderiales bacterium]
MDGQPTKKDYTGNEGAVSQEYYAFLMNKLWKPNGRQLRDQLIAASQGQLKEIFTANNIPFDPNVKILVVDLETARTNGFEANPSPLNFYTFVLPPEPRRNSDEPHYKAMQAWATAYYHAINDSYGM